MTALKQKSKKLVRYLDQEKSLYERYARRNGLTGKSLQLLLWIYYNPQGVTQRFLGDKTLSTKQVVNATIKTWLNQGYLLLKENPCDKRQKMVQLTESGRAYASALLDPLEILEISALESLDTAERDQLLDLFSRYTSALQKEMEKI